jgi:putative MATE family efflux protein
MNSATRLLSQQQDATRPRETTGQLLRAMLVLSIPVLLEQVLNMLVSLTDTYLANHVAEAMPTMTEAELASVHATTAAAGAAVGTISYIMWFVGLITGAIGTGSTALISRATGARHRSLANSICGQSMILAVIAGIVLGILFYVLATPISVISGLEGQAREFARSYIQILSIAMPLMTILMVANACLRGAGDTFTPFVAYFFVAIINLVVSYGLTFGVWGFPKLGFNGIAIGTVVSYMFGGIAQTIVLLIGRGELRLFVHRLIPHWHNLKRLLRIGVPSGLESSLNWGVNFVLIIIINAMDRTNASGAAHNITVRIEGISYLMGFAFAVAAATMVGKSLGMKDPQRASRCARLAFIAGGAMMTTMGLLFITLGHLPARWFSQDAQIIEMVTRCLFITGFIQTGFAAAMVFGGALRGAGDTFVVMIVNLASVLLLRLTGVVIVGWYLRMGLAAIWIVLSIELMIRGALLYARFASGKWKHVKV